MALFWKRKKEPEYISLGLNREATAEEKEIAARRDEGPEPDLVEKIKGAVASTRESISERIESVVAGRRTIDAEVLDELEEALIGADIGAQASLDIIEKARQQVKRNQLNDVDELKRLIKSELKAILDSAERNRKRGTVASETEVPLDIRPYVIMVVGVNGVGKTTTIGKLSHRIKSEGNEVLICAADTFRAAANDQLKIWADRSGVPLIQQKPGTDPSAVLFDSINAARARNADVLIVDTAGRLHTKTNLMQELEKMRRIAGREVEGAPHEVLLVMDAVTGQNGLEQARQFTRSVPVTGLVLTKLDGTAKGGIVIAIARELGIPIRYVGTGEQMNDLVEFSPEAYVAGLFD
ncbi:MAG TPA: signal recognition particle-docking protein FtsY [Blastocatellia bacterium]|nr:signal recognition particle-docking protein FtsY [Blastocatellia bacterium]